MGQDWRSEERWWRSSRTTSRRMDRWSSRKLCALTWEGWRGSLKGQATSIMDRGFSVTGGIEYPVAFDRSSGSEQATGQGSVLADPGWVGETAEGWLSGRKRRP